MYIRFMFDTEKDFWIYDLLLVTVIGVSIYSNGLFIELYN